mmetsp:Transcript_12607/g.35768  ORF Transcript_12607/g.35768 Transcript_12607/m.35768 type:complete len:201 (+) Transcript_12607:89-691(+)|eukprot:CAMPEP_0172375260 /NCGR_PEP_ID=MMETSP1060-20121228/60604_1 /TAXON_ID=37318 /ORGANISM="Pseudo-nitzschia pungens, Strain cf. cingulata" /LENGTH=200 /DNA_ID=CAMNT_0013102305 /DNA_START=47 /DNA_END=649 /DNA_ORIENTATION=+
MVVGDVLCAVNLAASIMVNGVCCYYQMSEQNERREQQNEAIQKSIRTELKLHRRRKIIDKRNELIQAHKEAVTSPLIDERRGKLMTLKANLKARMGRSNGRDQPMDCEQLNAPATEANHPTIISNNSFSSTIGNSDIASTLESKPTTIVLTLPRASCERGDKSQRNNIAFRSKSTNNNTSSLFDGSLEDNNCDFEEIGIE